jgi:hypothetical protein
MWHNKLSKTRVINVIAYHARFTVLVLFFFSIAFWPATSSYYRLFSPKWTSHDTPTCYLLSHCQFEHPVCLGTSPVTNRCLHSYQHLHCDYSAWEVTLFVLELVQLADMCRFIVVCWVKSMNWIECITAINISKPLSRYDKLQLMSYGLSVVWTLS